MSNPRTQTEKLIRAAWVRVAVVVAILIVAALLLHGRIDAAAIHRYAERLNGGAAFGLLVILPLLGFPASVLHVAAGIRFGAVLGLSLVSLSILLQLLASYGLVHRFRHRFEKRFAHLRRRIPPGAHASICVFAVLLPGAPFAAVNYVLPMTGVRLRTYLLCCWPLHTLRSTITVLLGDQSDKFTPARLAVLGGYALLLTVGSWWLYRNLRRRLADQPAAADGRMQPA
jgi:uncharacterized membrane protein YdjX (TVP38/TMEM64 family)